MRGIGTQTILIRLRYDNKISQNARIYLDLNWIIDRNSMKTKKKKMIHPVLHDRMFLMFFPIFTLNISDTMAK